MEMIGPESDKIETLDVARRIWTTIVNKLILAFLYIGVEQKLMVGGCPIALSMDSLSSREPTWLLYIFSCLISLFRDFLFSVFPSQSERSQIKKLNGSWD